LKHSFIRAKETLDKWLQSILTRVLSERKKVAGYWKGFFSIPFLDKVVAHAPAHGSKLVGQVMFCQWGPVRP
jgi:hypothetical protein